MLNQKKTVCSSFHHQEPDYARSSFCFSQDVKRGVLERLTAIYGKDAAETWLPELERICQVYYAYKPQALIDSDCCFDADERFTEKDLIVITYGDLIEGEGASPLDNLAKFCDSIFVGAVNTLHILPFFPYSSDRGFSIIDFETVDPNLGTWKDINALDESFELMFDMVVNHVSSESKWFKEFLNGNKEYEQFFISYDSPDKLSPEERKLIFRPRTSDVLSEFQTLNGPRYVWTTFSRDQIDLNYANPKVLAGVLELLLFYIRHGANIIRLDAVTYLWKEHGTPCVHLEQTHQIIKLFRDLLREVAPQVALITETNVPHRDNISYFGSGYDEANMVYNFTLPPLVLHTFYREDSTALTRWAQALEKPSPVTHFFEFLDSHDGIGLMGVKDILSEEDIAFIAEKAQKYGGIISYKSGSNGQDIPYEMNITWYSALNRDDVDEGMPLQVKRFIASRTIALVLQGVPGIYFHSIVGTEND
ncbi:MAG: sugar phosphorylase, partial [Kiritimatiellae bacterium]|nr:sugar phosphorylase [Kiritimatiellia bacterium]